MRQPRSIRTRLLLALMLMTLLTLTIASGVSALMDLRLFRDHMLRDLQVLAAVVGENCVSALVFNSPESAERNLATLSVEYQVRSATLYDAKNAAFARWQRPSEASSSPAPRIAIEHLLEFDRQPVGRLVLEIQLDELARQRRGYAWFASALALLTLAAALLLALWLQRRIARPILELVDATRAVSERQDFSLRVPTPRAEREIGTLVTGFNQMLAQIEQRETALNQANATLRRLAADLSLLEETEKARLAAELHDGPMQKLALAQMQIDAAIAADDDDDSRGEAAQQLSAGIELMREAIGELRTLQFELSPPVLHKRGLSAALDWLAGNTRERWGIDLRFAVDADLPRLSRRQSVILFQCARELVHNLIKHSGASRGMIRLTADTEGLALRLEDNGRGFDAANTELYNGATGGSYGLYSVRERLRLLGGTLDIQSDLGGALLLIRLPLAELRP
jgi:signal transduction histidine kinase